MTKSRTRRSYTRRAVLAGTAAAIPALSQSPGAKSPAGREMDLGVFSVSLAVKDLAASRAFYEKLGFKVLAAHPSGRLAVLKNGDAIIGLFQGMFDKNILTFNPGWDGNAQKKASFTDVRELQRRLKADGIEIAKAAEDTPKGPASFVIYDPDGNQILIDQHV